MLDSCWTWSFWGKIMQDLWCASSSSKEVVCWIAVLKNMDHFACMLCDSMHKVFLSAYVWKWFVMVHLLCRPSASCEALPSFLRQPPACLLILQWPPGLLCWPPCQWEPRLSSSRVAWMKQCQTSKHSEGKLENYATIENLWKSWQAPV